jgi:hypothetical protein
VHGGNPRDPKHNLFYELEQVLTKTGNGGDYILAIRDTLKLSMDRLKPLTEPVHNAKLAAMSGP